MLQLQGDQMSLWKISPKMCHNMYIFVKINA
jgi:hypothetical protein